MWRSKVLWSEGLFLRPQHFQQQERWIVHQLDRRARALDPFGWGFEALEIDEELLGLGKLGVRAARGILPDGTVFAAPQDDALPAPLDVPAGKRDTLLYLGVPLERPGAAQAVLGEAPAHALFRYQAQATDITDDNEGFSESAAVQIGRLRLRLMTADDRTEAFAAMPIARLVERRADGRVVLDGAYVAPTLSANDSVNPAAWLSELRGTLRQTAESLAGSMTQPGRSGVAEIAEFLWLIAVDRYVPLLDHLATIPRLHPERLYSTFLALAGDLVGFMPQRRFERPFPAYDHDDLAATFRPVVEFLRQAFGHLPQKSAVQIPLQDRGYNYRVATVSERALLDKAVFVLAASAQMPSEVLRLHFPNQTKIGPVDRLQRIVELQLPAVGLQALPAVPRQIPLHAGFNYFEIDTRHELWRHIAGSGIIGMHVGGEFPGLELELWAIRT